MAQQVKTPAVRQGPRDRRRASDLRHAPARVQPHMHSQISPLKSMLTQKHSKDMKKVQNKIV